MTDPSLTTDPARTDEPRWIPALLFVLAVVVLPVVTIGLSVERFPELSVLDEPAHIDYLRRIEDGGIPRIGDKMLPETARDIACRTIGGRQVADCDLPVVPIDLLDASGYSYEAQQPPVYYAVTAVLRQPLALVVDDFVDSARLTGIVWLSGGLALLWSFLRRRVAASAVSAAIACAIVGLAPMVVGQSALVNNDAAAVLIGATVLWGYDRLRRRPTGRVLAWVTAGAVLVVLVKPLAILPVGAAAVALLVEALVRRARVREVLLLLVPAAAALFTYQAWQVVRDARATVPYSAVTDVLLSGRARIDDFPFTTVSGLLLNLLTAYDDRAGVQTLALYVTGFGALVGLLFVYGPSIATALGQGRRTFQALHLGIVAVSLAAPPLLITQSYLVVHQDGGANSRYAIALFPMMVTAVVPWMDDSRWVRRAAGLGMAMLLAVTLYSLGTHEVSV